MKCEICGELDALIHIQQIVGNDVYDLHICEVCAQEKGIYNNESADFSLSELLTGLIDVTNLGKKRNSKRECPNCGKKWEEVKKEGIIGCIECYSVFKKEIQKQLEQTVTSLYHKGKYPKNLKQYKTLLIDKEIIKQKLEEAVQREDYETAATLRDQMSDLEKVSGDFNEQST